MNASATPPAQQHLATSEPLAAPQSSDAPTHSSAATLPSVHLVWVCCAQAAVQSAVLGVGTGAPGASTPTPRQDPSSLMRPPGHSLLQESFWRHSHPQLKARSSASHHALDWLYPALAAVAAVEQALLQPSSGLTYGAQFDAQVRLLQLVAQVLCSSWARLLVGAVLAVRVRMQSVGVVLGL